MLLQFTVFIPVVAAFAYPNVQPYPDPSPYSSSLTVRHAGHSYRSWRRQAPAPADDLAKFGDVVPILGQMERTDQDFVDGLALDLFSPKNRTVVVQQNLRPLPGNFVTGSTGEAFMALSNYSYVIKFNETANDLIAKVELPYDPVILGAIGLDVSNTYVGQLSSDKMSWNIDETRRNVHISENKTRIIKMTSLDGEFILLGRKNIDTTNVFVQYGQGATRTVNVTGGPGTQEAEFVDGLRFSVRSQQAFSMNADLKFGVQTQMLPAGMTSLNPYSWVVNTSMSQNAGLQQADINFPVNQDLVMQKGQTTNMRFVPARRALNGTGQASFQLLGNGMEFQTGTKTAVVKASGMKTLDGEYIILVDTKAKRDTSEGWISKGPQKPKRHDSSV